MAEGDISVRNCSSKKSLALVSSRSEQWATANGYDTAPAVSPTHVRTYADSDTQAAFDAWNAGAAGRRARTLNESTLETEALREKPPAIAVSE
jgi:hypothetical protein